jgi:pyridoxine 5-phosphate synthase
MAGLTILVDHVAVLRETMHSVEPEPLAAAMLAVSAGADGIGVFLREAYKPVRERDVRLLRQALHSRMVLYMAATSEMVGLALDVKPERVVLMPAMREEGTMEDRFEVVSDSKVLYETVDTLQSKGISVGVSIDPEPDQVKTVHRMRADWVHLHAGRLRAADTAAAQRQALNKMIDAVKMAQRLRLHIAVGHGLDYKIIKLFTGMHEIDEFSLGRHLIARAVLVGMDRAVRDMVALIRSL